LPILPLDELPIKNNKLKNKNSRVKYRERRKKKLALQMAGNPTSDPDNNPLTAAPSPSTTTSCPQACDGTLPPKTAMTLPPITTGTLPPTNRDWDHVELNQGEICHRLVVGKKAPGIGCGHGRPQVSSRAGASIQNNSSKSGTCEQVGSHCQEIVQDKYRQSCSR